MIRIRTENSPVVVECDTPEEVLAIWNHLTGQASPAPTRRQVKGKTSTKKLAAPQIEKPKERTCKICETTKPADKFPALGPKARICFDCTNAGGECEECGREFSKLQACEGCGLKHCETCDTGHYCSGRDKKRRGGAA